MLIGARCLSFVSQENRFVGTLRPAISQKSQRGWRGKRGSGLLELQVAGAGRAATCRQLVVGSGGGCSIGRCRGCCLKREHCWRFNTDPSTLGLIQARRMSGVWALAGAAWLRVRMGSG